MAILNDDARVRLLIRLLYYWDLLNDTSTSTDNHIDAASETLKSILDLTDYIYIHLVPGNEWERLYDLRQHCHRIEILLMAACPERETIHRGVHEALEQYCYLLEFESIRLAALIETLCLARGDTLDQ